MALTTATALAIGSIAVSAGSAGMSFAEAGKQRKLQQEAESEAAKALVEARKKLDVNFYEGLSINKEPYELEREALVAAGAQAIQAGQESERGAAATAGRIQMAQQQGQREIAGAMGAEMAGLEKLTAAEDSRLAGAQANLYLAEAEGAQLAARDAQQAATAYTTAGVKGIGTAAQQTLTSLVPLYSKTGVDAPAAAAAPTAGKGTILNPVQTPLASAPQGSLMQIAPQGLRTAIPQGNTTQQGSPLDPFKMPAIGGFDRGKFDLMSRDELYKLLTGGK
jgi:hypothetical protein